MIVGGQTEARAQLSSTIIDYHEPFDQGFRLLYLLSNRSKSKIIGVLATQNNLGVRKTRTPVKRKDILHV